MSNLPSPRPPAARARRGLAVLGAAMAGAAALSVALALLVLDAAPELRAEGSRAETPMLERLRHQARLHDPRRARPDAPQVLALRAEELRWIVQQGGRLAGGAADVELGSGRAEGRASLPLARRRAWINARVRVQVEGGSLRVTALRVGAIELEGATAHAVAGWLWAGWERFGPVAPPLVRMVDGVQIDARRLVVAYRWPGRSAAEFVERVAERWWPAAEQDRWHAYHDALHQALDATPPSTPAELTALMPPLIALARSRSGHDEPRAVEENRAALVTLALYVLGRPVPTLLPAARTWAPLPWRWVTLGGRDDFPRHLLVSAVLAAEADGPLADAVGMAKEVDDSRHGSGFSFTDVAVNRAGARLGDLAVHDALRLQAALGAGLSADDLLPPLADLPEFLPEREFIARFGGIGAPGYRRLIAEIDARVAAMPLLR